MIFINLKINQILFVLLILLSGASLSCYTTGAKSESEESLSDIKWKFWQIRTSDESTSLKTIVSYSLDQSIGHPSSFIISNDFNIYLVDNNKASILRISENFESITQVVKKEPNRNNLEYPLKIKEFNDNLYVNDNDGLKIIKRNGEIVDTIQNPLRIFDFSVNSREGYLINVGLPKTDKKSPLIVKLDSNGKKIDTIGEAQFSEYNEIENNTFIETNEKVLYLGYKFVPLVEIYDIESKKLISSFSIKASIFNDLVDFRNNKGLTNPRPGVYRLPTFLAGVKVFNDKFYVLLHLPYPEIIEFTLSGEEVKRYRSKELKVEDYFGFDVRSIGNNIQFVVGAFSQSHTPSIMVYEVER